MSVGVSSLSRAEGSFAGSPGRGSTADDPSALIAALAILAALVLGGGGTPNPGTELALQLAMAGFGIAWIALSGRSFSATPPLGWLIGLALALPLIQLVPLPPALWHALPGRETERAALALIGQAESWRPWTMTPTRTLASLLAILPALAIMLMTASLDRAGRGLVVAMIAGVGLVSLVVAAGQMAGGDEGNPFRFYHSTVGVVEGFEGNRNHAADSLIIAMVACVAMLRELAQRRQAPGSRRTPLTPGLVLALAAGASALFGVAVFMTASRTGIVLLGLGWLAVLALMQPWLNGRASPLPRLSRRGWLALGSALAFALVSVVLLALSSPAVQRVLGRFSFEGEIRGQIWQDSAAVIARHFPFGAGVGSFIPVFEASEKLERINTLLINRAHNEVLEILVEGGLFGLTLLLAALAIVIGLAWRAWRNPPAGSRAQVLFGTTVLAVIALHSLVEYPMRKMSLECLAGVAIGLLSGAARKQWPATAAKSQPVKPLPVMELDE